MKDEFLLHGVTSSTGGCAVLVIVNGPIRLEIGANPTFNALGNSDRATAVIGRAMRLALINLMDVRPGGIDRSTLGHPGKYSYCLAEDEEDTTLAAAVRGARHAAGRLRRHRHGGHGAAPDHERVDHGPERDPGDVRGGDARQPAHLLDLRRQLRHRRPQAAARAHPGRRLDASRTWPSSCSSARGCAAANGPMSARARSCATGPTRSIRRSARRRTCWWWPRAVRRAASAPSSRRGWAARPGP